MSVVVVEVVIPAQPSVDTATVGRKASQILAEGMVLVLLPLLLPENAMRLFLDKCEELEVWI